MISDYNTKSLKYRHYKYPATEPQPLDDPNVAALFFIEKDLHLGKEMNLHFPKITTGAATLLPRRTADSIPFSSKKLPEILNKFSVKTGSAEAAAIKKTIEKCKGSTAIVGGEKFCATSLESMVDFTTSKLGKNVDAISTYDENQRTDDGLMRKYSIVGVEKITSTEKAPVVTCHRQEHVYAVFYGHKTDKTVAYKVSMAAGDGSTVEAAAVCHWDMAACTPQHLAFQVLKVKPGALPFCHFLPDQDHIVWVSKY